MAPLKYIDYVLMFYLIYEPINNNMDNMDLFILMNIGKQEFVGIFSNKAEAIHIMNMLQAEETDKQLCFDVITVSKDNVFIYW